MSLEKIRFFHKHMLIVVIIWILVCLETLFNNQVILSCQSDTGPDKGSPFLIPRQTFKNYTASFDGVRSEAVLSVVGSLGAPPFSVLHNDKRFSEWHAGTKKALEEEVSNNTREEWGPGSDEQKQKKQQKTRMSECVCQCRPSDRAIAGRSISKPCRLQWTRLNTVTIPTLAPTHNRSDPGPVSSTGPGRRCRRLQCRAWNVDITPNPRGQAQRNCLGCRDKRVDLLCLTSNCPSRNGHRGVVDLLLMSERQRKGIEGSGVLNVILVSLACLVLLLGDHSRQKTANLLPLLRRPLMATKWTASVEKATKDFFRSYSPATAVSWDRSVSRLESLGKVSKNSLDPFELCFSFVGQFPPPTRQWVAPATGFLPSVTPGDTRILDHVGYRLASLAALPAACAVSRVRLAEAGFHYDPRANPAAAVCHACGLTYSLEPPGDASSPTPPPMALHRAQSPQCQLLTSVLARCTGPRPVYRHLYNEEYCYESHRYSSFTGSRSFSFWVSRVSAEGYFLDPLTKRIMCFACGSQHGFPHTDSCTRSRENIPFPFFPELPWRTSAVVDLEGLNIILTPSTNEELARRFNVRLRQGCRRDTVQTSSASP